MNNFLIFLCFIINDSLSYISLCSIINIFTIITISNSIFCKIEEYLENFKNQISIERSQFISLVLFL